MQSFRRHKKLWSRRNVFPDITLIFVYRCVDYLYNHDNLLRLRADMHSYVYINSLNIYLQKTDMFLAHRSRRLTGELIV